MYKCVASAIPSQAKAVHTIEDTLISVPVWGDYL